MHFRPESTNTIEGRSAIELWDDDGQLAATIYAQRAGLHIVFEPGYEPDQRNIAIEVQDPVGYLLGITKA